MASARPASARFLRPKRSRRFTGAAAAARWRTMGSMTVSTLPLPDRLRGRGTESAFQDYRFRLGDRGIAPPRACVGGRSRSGTKGRGDERATAFAVNQHGLGFRPVLAVDDYDTGALRSEM